MSSTTYSLDRRRFIQTPIDLILAYRTHPRHAAVYALIARLCEIARPGGAVTQRPGAVI